LFKSASTSGLVAQILQKLRRKCRRLKSFLCY